MSQLESGGDQIRYSPYRQLTITRFREFIRQPAVVFWVYVFPLLVMIAMGVAFRTRPIGQVSVLIENNTHAERLLAAFEGDPQIRARIATAEECRTQLRVGKVDFVLVGISIAERSAKANTVQENSSTTGETAVIDRGYHDASRGGLSAGGIRYEYYYDPTKPASLLARNSIETGLQRSAGRQYVVTTSDYEVGGPGGRYVDFLIPGLLGVGIMRGGLFGLGYAIVDMRIRKLIKRLVATPMKRSHFLAAVMTSRMLFTIPEILVLLVVARLLFGVVIHGSYVTLGLLILLGTIEFAGIGLLVASRAKTTETVNGLISLIMLPMWIASGIFFSYERFPSILQPVIRILPLTPLIDSVRAVMLEGRAIDDLLSPIGIMLVWAIVTFLLALRWFRWN